MVPDSLFLYGEGGVDQALCLFFGKKTDTGTNSPFAEAELTERRTIPSGMETPAHTPLLCWHWQGKCNQFRREKNGSQCFGVHCMMSKWISVLQIGLSWGTAKQGSVCLGDLEVGKGLLRFVAPSLPGGSSSPSPKHPISWQCWGQWWTSSSWLLRYPQC